MLHGQRTSCRSCNSATTSFLQVLTPLGAKVADQQGCTKHTPPHELAAGASQHGAVRVLDLGCAPGAWLQMACTILGKKQNPGSLIYGLDLQVQPQSAPFPA